MHGFYFIPILRQNCRDFLNWLDVSIKLVNSLKNVDFFGQKKIWIATEKVYIPKLGRQISKKKNKYLVYQSPIEMPALIIRIILEYIWPYLRPRQLRIELTGPESVWRHSCGVSWNIPVMIFRSWTLMIVKVCKGHLSSLNKTHLVEYVIN